MKLLFVVLTFLSSTAFADSNVQFKGFNLTELDGFVYEANLSAQNDSEKTNAQIAVDEMKRLGANTVVLNPKAFMTSCKSNVVEFNTYITRYHKNLRGMISNYKNLIRYIKSQGMKVGIRPNLYLVEDLENLNIIMSGCWHGNIKPSDPNAWFQSFNSYVVSLAKNFKNDGIDQFTIGAELYSVTVGIEDQWKEYPYGFPAQWNEILRNVRAEIPNAVIMYDINFTDQKAGSGGIGRLGGELERWRYRLVDLAPSNKPNLGEDQRKIWEELVAFWSGLDAIGIDMYRSLATNKDKASLPKDYDQLVNVLASKAGEYAAQLDQALLEIETTINVSKPIVFKEVGYKSKDYGFINPFEYAAPNVKVNIAHQAAGTQAFLRAFWNKGNYPWFDGVVFWDVSVNPALKGVDDGGFSPIGKKQTEDILIKYFSGNH
jgi:hypothetical protein